MGTNSREHRRANKHEREKTERRTFRRIEQLTREQRQGQAYEELEKPVFWGYRREFVLRRDIAARNDASKWRAILELVQNVEHSRRKDFKWRSWPSKRWREKEHSLGVLSPREYLKKVPMRFRRYFHHAYDDRGMYYFFIYPWMTVSRRTKVYHTHRRVLNLELEREMSYLEDRYEQNLYRQAYLKQKHGSLRWKNYNRPEPREKHRDKFSQAEVHEALLMWNEGDSFSNI